jgi:arginine exporter protein ArgO
VIFDFDVVLAAFEKFGLDCASWNEPVYLDLLRFDLIFFIVYYSIILLMHVSNGECDAQLDFMSSCQSMH